MKRKVVSCGESRLSCLEPFYTNSEAGVSKIIDGGLDSLGKNCNYTPDATRVADFHFKTRFAICSNAVLFINKTAGKQGYER